jgi:hypothetical protein
MTRSLELRIRIVATAVALAASSGCVARYIRMQEKGVTCVAAHQIAVQAVRRMGYTITAVTKADPGTPGMIIASREEGLDTHSLVVSVVCTIQGAEVEAKTDQGGLAAMTFPDAFKRSFEAAAADKPPPRAAAESGLDVLLTPERGAGELGVDLSGAGVLPVSVRITNRTPRTYGFHARHVVLQTANGDRSHPLGTQDIVANLSPEQAEIIQQKALGDRIIAPQETVTGLLFFPFKPYQRAHVELTDRASDEVEGFSIEF